MATIESVIALRDKITSTLFGVSNAAVQAAQNMAKLESSVVSELVTSSGIGTLNTAADAAEAVSVNMGKLQKSTAIKLVGVEDVNDVSKAAVQATIDMSKLESSVVNELVTSSGIGTLNTAAEAAEAASLGLAKLQNPVANDLIGIDDVNRMDLLAKQATLMEAKWINQQNHVAALTKEYDNVVKAFGYGSSEAEKLNVALLQAQLQENRLALAAVKVAEDFAKQEQKAAKVQTEIESQILASGKAAQEAQKIVVEEENIKRRTKEAVDEQSRFSMAAGHSHLKLLNLYAAVNLIKTGIRGLTGLLNGADEYTGISARLGLINDGLMTQKQLQSEIYRAAQNTRSTYTDTADMITRIGMNANGLFNNNKSLVNFAELTNKAMKISGGSQTEISQALTQLTQGLGAGVLKGQDFKSMMGNAGGQTFFKYMAEGMDVPMGKLQQLAGDGKLTAAVVAESLSKASEKINADFATLPKTFGDNMTSMKNTAMAWIDSLNQAGNPLDAINQKISQFAQWLEGNGGQQLFQNITTGAVFAGTVIMPVVDGVAFQITRLMNLANSPGNQAFFQSLGTYAHIAGNSISWVAQTAGDLVSGIVSQWPLIEPIVLGVVAAFAAYNAVQLISKGAAIAHAAAEGIRSSSLLIGALAAGTAEKAQWGLNASLLACPVTWIVLAIGGLIGTIVVLSRYITNLWNTNDEFAIWWIRAWNKILGFTDSVPMHCYKIWDKITTIFENGKTVALSIMESLVNGVIGSINWLIEKMNKIPGIQIEAIGNVSWAAENDLLSQARQQTRAEDIAAMIAENEAKAAQREKDALAFIDNRAAKRAAEQAKLEAENTNDIIDAYSIEPYQNDGTIGVNMDYGADFNIGRIKETVDISSQDLKYLRDIAEREAINEFTTNTIVPQMQVSFGDVKETADVETVLNKITEWLAEQMAAGAEGVHA